MSQIVYASPHPVYGVVQVQTGWDRMLQAFHWTLFDEDDNVLDEDSILIPVMDASEVVAALKRAGVKTPPELLEILEVHQMQDYGNVRVEITLPKEDKAS